MKKFTFSVATIFVAGILTSCGSQNNDLLTMPVVENAPVQASSYKGINKEMEKAVISTFNDLDKNRDKIIVPAEFGVQTPAQAQAFYAMDDNHDGKVTLKELTPNFFSKVGANIRIGKAANALFKELDSSRDGYLSPEELDSNLITPEYVKLFKKYDVEQPGKIFNTKTKGKLSKSEFQNLFAHIAVNPTNTGSSAPEEISNSFSTDESF